MTVSVLRTRSGSALFVSTDSSTREYVPDGTPIALILTVAEVKKLVMDTHDSSEPVFYLRLIASMSLITSSAWTWSTLKVGHELSVMELGGSEART